MPTGNRGAQQIFTKALPVALHFLIVRRPRQHIL
jgi:hypothetical protein